MTTQPLRVPRPHFAKRSWLILPVIAYAMLWWLSAHDITLGILIGPLMDAPVSNANGASLGSSCEYVRLGARSVALVEMPRVADGCPMLRIFSEDEGPTLRVPAPDAARHRARGA